jgi:hypothetical protein
MSSSTRAWAEQRFGQDFGAVRLHDGPHADAAAHAVAAQAFTAGQHIVFGDAASAPESSSRRGLLAHELAHVAQVNQGQVPRASGAAAEVSQAGDALERDADRAAARALAPAAASMPVAGAVQSRAPRVQGPGAPMIQRYIDWEEEKRARRRRHEGYPGLFDPRAAREAQQEREERDLREQKIESQRGVDVAIRDKTLVEVPGIHGKSFLAFFDAGGGMLSLPGSVKFTFDKAHVGQRTDAGGRESQGLYIKLSVTERGGECDELRLLQLFRWTTRDATGALESRVPSLAAQPPAGSIPEWRQKLAGWDASQSDWEDPADASRGWMVDTITPHQRYISELNQPGKAGGFSGKDGGPAVIWDYPGLPLSVSDAGMEFYTCAVCIRRGEPPTPLASVRWGYYIDAAGALAPDPATPTTMSGAPDFLPGAMARFEKNPEPTPPPQAAGSGAGGPAKP